jgi:hypothetical protein
MVYKFISMMPDVMPDGAQCAHHCHGTQRYFYRSELEVALAPFLLSTGVETYTSAWPAGWTFLSYRIAESE